MKKMGQKLDSNITNPNHQTTTMSVNRSLPPSLRQNAIRAIGVSTP
jgi:hypothetical protein